MAAGNTYIQLATNTLTGAAASITFSSISGAYTDLVLVCAPIAASGNNNMDINFNGDTGSNYSRMYLTGTGAAVSAARVATQTKIRFTAYGLVTTGQGVHILNIMNYANTTTYKTVLSRSNNTAYGADVVVSSWASTAAITSLVLVQEGAVNFASGSVFSLYGIAAA